MIPTRNIDRMPILKDSVGRKWSVRPHDLPSAPLSTMTMRTVCKYKGKNKFAEKRRKVERGGLTAVLRYATREALEKLFAIYKII